MESIEIISGQKRAWSLIKKVGEGDAGEVYLVESLLEKERAILKRPHRSAFTSDIVRQASQIEREGEILRSLNSLSNFEDCISIPKLLDQGKAGSEHSDRFFIIISQASGFDLNTLARCIHFRSTTTQGFSAHSPEELAFLHEFSNQDSFPHLILLRIIKTLISYLEAIHTLEGSSPSMNFFGIIWNDVKSEHLFWHPARRCLSIIDWGNSQFLNSDGITQDQLFSRIDDYVQLLEEFGKFLVSNAPELYNLLEWPNRIPAENAYTEGILPIKEKVGILLSEELDELQNLRSTEAKILETSSPEIENFRQLEKLHVNIVASGESPDYSSLQPFLSRLSVSLISEHSFTDFQDVCRWSSLIPFSQSPKWHLLDALSEKARLDLRLLPAIESGVNDDYPEMLWNLRIFALDVPEPKWWPDFSAAVRQLYLGAEPITPFVALNRLIHTLEAMERGTITQKATEFRPSEEDIRVSLNQGKRLLQRWTQFEPDPPDADLSYREAEQYITSVAASIPEGALTFEKSLTQPIANLQIVLDAWGSQNFETARKALRNMLIWDPDRQRIIIADQAIRSTPEWLEEISNGPGEESRTNFVTRLALIGQELRRQVGPAAWLDDLLGAFKLLRKGVEPTDVMLQYPNIRRFTGWLLEIERDRPILLSFGKQLSLERTSTDLSTKGLTGRRETELGKKGFILADPLDAWASEARGSSARVFLGTLDNLQEETFDAAVKIMRPGREDYALQLFIEEVKILQLLINVPGVTPLLECGFIELQDERILPAEDRSETASLLNGRAQRFGSDLTRPFLVEIVDRVKQGWLPYIALARHLPQNNLLLLCDASYTHGRILPILDGLVMAIQICDILDTAHERGIAYRDHKILHYYWIESHNGVFMIDWNIAQLHEGKLTTEDRKFDLVQFGARALHHILTGRSAPGALPLGPNRPEEIDSASNSYAVQWTYDDQRLPQSLKDLLEKLLIGEYISAKDLRADLYEIYQRVAMLLKP